MNTHSRRAAVAASALALLTAGALAGCTVKASPETAARTDTVTLVTHDSFALSDGLIEQFEEESGLHVEFVAPGDGGALANQLVLTKDAPLGDAVFGIDNSFASRIVDAGVIDAYDSPALDAGAAQYVAEGLVPIDLGDVCLNVDTAWFQAQGVTVPKTLEEVAGPAYRDLTVVTNPATSSPGLAFVLATVGAFGDGWVDYWSKLAANGLRVADGWSDAYYVDFSATEGGTRPIVLSYSTSPAFTLTEDGTASTTAALLDTCFRQVEYAGVLSGAKNPEGAKRLIDWLLSDAVQEDIPGSMYMYPVNPVELPAEWEQFAPLSPSPFAVAPAEIDAHRDEWIQTWTDTVLG